MANLIVKPSIANVEKIEIRDEGEDVMFRVADVVMRFHYADMLAISQKLRVAAKAAKHRAGDRSRHWSVVATASDYAKITNGG